MKLTSQQITFGPSHHFFGYIGHCRTIPWNGNGRYIACLQTDFQDRMPTAHDAARVVLLDTQNGFSPVVIDRTYGWNPQQGAMLYWNPTAADTQLFFNDRDPATGSVFTVLFDIAQNRRIREYRYDDTPIGNGGIAQAGGKFAAINYGRLARLRPVTGYPEARDWSAHQPVPDNDGLFIVDIATAKPTLICSYRQMVDHLIKEGAATHDDDIQIFLNHTLWNREDDLILFFARSGKLWGGNAGKMLNSTFTIRPDGSGLLHHGYVGGHPEWDANSILIAAGDDGLELYDARQRKIVGTIGNKDLFSDPKGDKAECHSLKS